MTNNKFKNNKLKEKIILKEITDSKFQGDAEKLAQENVLIYLSSAMEKTKYLFEHYNIDSSKGDLKWILLCLKLAEDYVPGFQKKYGVKVKTKPISWTPDKYLTLYWHVTQSKKKNKKLSFKAICENLSRNNELYKGQISLNKRFSESKDSTLIKFFKNISDNTNIKLEDLVDMYFQSKKKIFPNFNTHKN